jgi:hypothetical protein
MGKVTWFGEAGPQHPAYGIHRANIASSLTAKNWERKALWRWHGKTGLYIYIASHALDDGTDDEDKPRYHVRVDTRGTRSTKFGKDFATLEEALAYANGEDSGMIAWQTKPATVESLPEEPGSLLAAGDQEMPVKGPGAKAAHISEGTS